MEKQMRYNTLKLTMLLALGLSGTQAHALGLVALPDTGFSSSAIPVVITMVGLYHRQMLMMLKGTLVHIRLLVQTNPRLPKTTLVS